MPVIVALEPVDQPDVATLIGELDSHLGALYPAESRHGLKLEALRATNILFSLARDEAGIALGCGGVALLDRFAELKRMYVRPTARGNGIGALVVRFLESQVLARGYDVMRLETGYKQLAALTLYERLGYARREPFAPCRPDPNSVFMEKRIGVNSPAA